MPASRDGKLWRSQFYYEDWQGVRHKKNKRGFKIKGEVEEWERNFRQQQQKDLDIDFQNFVEIYFEDMENRLRESTIINKRYVFDLKVTPYFKNKKMCEIKAADVRVWQNALIKKGYAATYLKSINNQLAALFNYTVKYYDLRDNPCRKAGSIGKSKAEEMDFWTKQEFTFSAGKHNELQKAIIEEFAPRFAPNSKCLYVGDTIEKDLVENIEKLRKLGFDFLLKDEKSVKGADEKGYYVSREMSEGYLLNEKKTSRYRNGIYVLGFGRNTLFDVFSRYPMAYIGSGSLRGNWNNFYCGWGIYGAKTV